VALLADSPRGNELLTNALNDSGKRAAMFGSVAVIRESGVNSLRVGDIYYVGHLPWFERIWFALSNHPVLLAILAAVSIVLHGCCGACCVLSAVAVSTLMMSKR
jgi:hypothetical protein